MTVRLNLEGEHGQIAAETLHAALGDLLGLLRSAAEVIDVGPQNWRVSALEAASAHVAMSATDEVPVSEVVADGLDALARVAAIPDRWTRHMVKHVFDLGRRVGSGGTTEVSVGLDGSQSRPLTAVLVDHAQRALGTATATRGSIRGKVDRWNEHGRREIGLSRESGPAVPATYPSDLSERVLAEALGHDIEAWGVIRRNVMGQITGMTIEDFTVLEPVQAVSIASLAGLYKSPDAPFTLQDWLADRHDG